MVLFSYGLDPANSDLILGNAPRCVFHIIRIETVDVIFELPVAIEVQYASCLKLKEIPLLISEPVMHKRPDFFPEWGTLDMRASLEGDSAADIVRIWFILAAVNRH